MAGRTGADGVFQALHHICHILDVYDVKLRALIAALVVSTVLTSGQATTVNEFLDTVHTVCDIFRIIADNNNIR